MSNVYKVTDLLGANLGMIGALATGAGLGFLLRNPKRTKIKTSILRCPDFLIRDQIIFKRYTEVFPCINDAESIESDVWILGSIAAIDDDCGELYVSCKGRPPVFVKKTDAVNIRNIKEEGVNMSVRRLRKKEKMMFIHALSGALNGVLLEASESVAPKANPISRMVWRYRMKRNLSDLVKMVDRVL